MPAENEVHHLGRSTFRIGEWIVQPPLNRLSRGETKIQLELKVMDVLVCLAERTGEVVTRIEITDRVWATEFIADNTLTHAINEIRTALGDDARNPSFIETIHRRGYRLMVPVTVVERPAGTVTQFPSQARPVSDDDRSPYPGLAVFTEADAEFFFGREAEIAQMWRKIMSRRLLAVIGPSGVGKSSFLRAGLIPAAPEGWGILICQPGEAPFAALARSLAPEFKEDADAIAQLIDIRESATRLFTRWRERHDQVLLIVDQFEELFTLNPPETQQQFAELVGRLARVADVHVLLSLRDDFLFRCHDHGPLKPVFDALTPVKVPGATALRRALVEPAGQLGFTFEDDELPHEMVAAVVGERGALPLLAFAIARLWERRDRTLRLLTREAYHEIGGVSGALAQHAEATLKAIGGDRLPIVREIFRNLITAEGTRAVREWGELLSIFSDSQRESPVEVLRQLINVRLLTSYEIHEGDEAPTNRVEIIHESLLANWPRLVAWQTQDADSARIRDELRQAARTWNDHDRTNDLLWTGAAYREYRLWRGRYPGGLTGLEEAFASAMTSHARWRKRRRRIAVAAAFVLLLTVLGVVGVSRQQAVAEANRAEAGKLVALGRLELSPDTREYCPSTAVAYAIAAIERHDSAETRLLALEALWRGPVGFRFGSRTYKIKPFSADGRWLFQPTREGDVLAWPRSGVAPTTIPIDFTRSFPSWGVFGTHDPDVLRVGAEYRMKPAEYWSIGDRRLLRSFGVDSPCRFLMLNREGVIICLEDRGRSTAVHELPLRGGEARFLGLLDSGVVDGAAASGRSLVTYSDRIISFHDLDRLEAGPRIVGEHDSQISNTHFDGAADSLVSADRSGVIKLWSLAPHGTGSMRSFQGPPGLRDIGLDGDRRTLTASSCSEGTTWLWNLRGPPDAEPLVLHLKFGKQVWSSTFDPQGRWVATGELPGNTMTMWPLLAYHPFVVSRDFGIIWDIRPHPGGNSVIVGSQDGSVSIWPLNPACADSKCVLFQAPAGYITDLDVDPEGRWVLASTTEEGGPWLIPLDGAEPLSLPGFNSSVFAVAFSPDGRFAAAGGGHSDLSERVIRIWDSQTREEVQILGPPDFEGPGSGQIVRLTYTPDGKRLISSGWTGVLIWDLDEGTYEYLGDGVATTITRDGKSLFVAWNDWEENGRSGVYDLETGKLTELPTHERVATIALSPDETMIVTGGVDGTIRVGPVSGEEPHILMGHTDYTGVEVSPDGRWIFSGGSDGSLRVWPMPDLSRPPLHTLPREELLAKLRSFTNFRAIRDDAAPNGYLIDFEPIEGWPTVPTW